MRTLVSASLAAALLVAASPAMAAASILDGEPKSEAGVKKVCRWIEPATGSRISERICLTAEQWKKVDKLLAE